MDNEFGMQELYFVQLKSTYPIEVKGQHFAAGEVLAVFDKIQIANFKDISREIAAQGGYNNRKLVIWDRVEGVDLVFVQGIFSPIQFGLLQNARLLKVNDSISISEREEIETNDQGIITLKHKPSNNWIFIYNKETGEKLTGLSRVSDTEIQTPLIYKDVVVDYQYDYSDGAIMSWVGEEIFDGVVTLEARSRIKDDVTGDTHTAIIRIPKLKITSDFNLTLGENAQPVVGKFSGTALPIGLSKQSKALEIYFLEDDIDKDSEWR